MSPEDFVAGVKGQACDSAVQQLKAELENNPNGLRSRRILAARSLYHAMDDQQKQTLLDLLAYCTEVAGFGFFAILDGARVIEGYGEKSEFRLTATREGQETLITDPIGAGELHDLFNSLCPMDYVRSPGNRG